MRLDELPIDECIALMIDDHRRVREAVEASRTQLTQFITKLVPRVRAGGRLIYVGAGTSGRLGVLDASECPPTFQSDPNTIIGIIAGGDASLRRSSEAMEDDPNGAAEAFNVLGLSQHDTVMGIAAGGTTPYVLGSLKIAARTGAMTGLLTCASFKKPPVDCDHLILLDTGPEILTGSTRLKAGSATKLALNIITTAVFVQLGKTYSNLMVDLRATNDKLTDRAIRILCDLCPDLDRPAAAELLHAASGECKTAIVMHHLQLDQPAARTLLDEHAGKLRRALESAHRSPVS